MRSPFFIVGTGRSGTNLTQQMLDTHPDINAVTETHFIRTLVRHFKTENLCPSSFFDVIANHWVSDGKTRWVEFHIRTSQKNLAQFKDHFVKYCQNKKAMGNAELVQCFFRCCYGEGDYLLGDKTPFYGLHMKEISEMFHRAKFIHLVRDGRYASTSMQKHPGFVKLINAGFPDKVNEYSYQGVQTTFDSAPITLESSISFWESIISATQSEAIHIPTENYLEIKYESLILNPIRELKKMATFLGVKVDKSWLKSTARIPNPRLLIEEKKRLTTKQFAALTEKAKDVLAKLDYFTGSLEELRKQKELYVPDRLQKRNRLHKLYRIQQKLRKWVK